MIGLEMLLISVKKKKEKLRTEFLFKNEQKNEKKIRIQIGNKQIDRRGAFSSMQLKNQNV